MSRTLAGLAALCAVSSAWAQAFVQDPQPAAPILPAEAAPAVASISPATPGETGNGFDRRLAERVAQAITDDPSLAGAAVTVTAKDGNVAISGITVDTLQAQRARQLADAIAGVGHVSSTLMTRRP